MLYEDLTEKILEACFEVSKELGAGFIESVYEKALIEEFTKKAIKVETQKVIDVIYKGKKIGVHRLDLVVEGKVVVEIKAVEAINDVHMAQILTYLKLMDCRLGYLINFNVPLIKNGIRRVINGLLSSE